MNNLKQINRLKPPSIKCSVRSIFHFCVILKGFTLKYFPVCLNLFEPNNLHTIYLAIQHDPSAVVLIFKQSLAGLNFVRAGVGRPPSPIQKLRPCFSHRNFTVRVTLPFIGVLVRWFETIYSLPQFHLVGTRWNPPFWKPLGTPSHQNISVRRTLPFIGVITPSRYHGLKQFLACLNFI